MSIISQYNGAIAVLQDKLRAALHRLWGVFAREVSMLRSSSTGMRGVSDKVSTLKRKIVAIRLCNNFCRELSELRIKVSVLKTQIALMATPPFPQRPAVSFGLSLDWRIVSDFPKIFAEFQGEAIPVSVRGIRDDFKAKELPSSPHRITQVDSINVLGIEKDATIDSV
jgi:hypothetical protein